MSLKSIIQNQTIDIDDHNWGNREVKNWDDSSKDVHLHKRTQFKIEGQHRQVDIRLPINLNNEIKITSNSNELTEVPRKLKKEITEAFKDRKTRENFIKDIVLILENYESNLDSLEKANDTLKRVSKHFGLNWTKKEIVEYIGESIEKIEKIEKVLIDDENHEYYISMNNKRIRIGDIDKNLRKELLEKGFDLI